MGKKTEKKKRGVNTIPARGPASVPHPQVIESPIGNQRISFADTMPMRLTTIVKSICNIFSRFAARTSRSDGHSRTVVCTSTLRTGIKKHGSKLPGDRD